MKCKTCGEPMDVNQNGQDVIKGWMCVPCYLECRERCDTDEELADTHEIWFRCNCLCPGDE